MLGRGRRRVGVLGVAFGLLASGLLNGVPRAQGATDTMNGDNLRTGWFQDQAPLQPGQVAANAVQLFDVPLNGQIYATPLIDHHQGSIPNLFVVTEANQVYWLDPGSGAVQNHLDLTPAETPFNANTSPVSCGDLNPTVGITGTPVLDTTTDVVYFVAKSYANNDPARVQFLMHARSMVAPYGELPNFPVTIQGSAQNQPGSAFNPTFENQRPGLLLSGNVVYAAFGGHCDRAPYAGWLMGVDKSSGVITTRFVDETPTSGGFAAGGGGSWMSGQAPMADAAGSVYIASGNGVVPATNGQVNPNRLPPGDLGTSVIKLSRSGPGPELTATDFFTPQDAVALNTRDADLGSGGLTGLPDTFGTPTVPHLAVIGGKGGTVYLLNRDHLGGARQGNPARYGGDDVLQEFSPLPALFGKASVWGGDGGYVYLGGNRTGSTVHAYQRTVDATTGTPQLALAGVSNESFGWSSTPIVTSTASNPGSAVVWIERMDGTSGLNGALLAYEPVPASGKLKLLRSFDLTAGSAAQVSQKMTTPMADGGVVYLSTREVTTTSNGHIRAFGATAGPALTAAPVDFGSVPQGGTVDRTVTLTAPASATAPVTVTGASMFSSAQYASDPAYSIPSPVSGTVNPGASLTFTVRILSASIGTRTGVVQVATSSGTTAVSLTATVVAQQSHVQFNQPGVDFGTLAYGSAAQQQSVLLSYSGPTSATVSSVNPGGPAFQVTGVALGATVSAAQPLTVTITFTPPASGPGTGASPQRFAQTLSIGSDALPNPLTLSLTAAAAPPAHLTVAPRSLDYGGVPVGQSRALAFAVTNDGGVNVSITLSKPPQGPDYVAGAGLGEGTQITPGQTVTLVVAFVPSRTGALTSTWAINASDGAGRRDVSFSGTGLAGSGRGYWLAAADGGIFPFGPAAGGYGSTGGIRLNQPIVGISSTPSNRGYWLVAADGGIFPFGDAAGFGSTGGIRLSQPVVGMATAPGGGGYWLVAADGGIFPFGPGAAGFGSTGGTRLNKPVVGMAAAPDGQGYWLVASDGGIFPFGPSAPGYGSTGNLRLNQPIVGMAATPSGHGYWLVASDGGIFPFGDAGGYGSTGGIRLNQPIVGMAATPDGKGYWLIASDGGIFPFGDAPGFGSTGNIRLNQPMIGMAAAS